MRCLYLSKAVIRNFRSIESLHLNNIGDITVLIGANESGKSNILLALKWFGNDKPLSDDDFPVDKDIKKDEVIIELYFKITNELQFRNLLESKINEEFENLLGIGSIAELNDLEIFYSFLKFQKHADGSFTCTIFDDRLKEVTGIIVQHLQNKIIKNIDLSTIFKNVFEKRLATLLSAKNIPKTQIPKGVNIVKNNPDFSNPLYSIPEKLSSFKLNNVKKPFSHLDTELQSIIIRIPNNTYTFNISGRSIQLNPQSLFAEVWNQIKSFDFEEFLQRSLKRMKPNFVYLVEEMELKGSVKKETTWSNTLREDNEKYVINSRLFSILGIDLDKFDKMDLERQNLELRNKLNVFSNKLSELWKQQKLRIVPIATPQEIILHIEEVDENNNSIKTTSPKMRSRGFKWYLAYLITLEYLKNKENTILLLDDPAVFLHEKGQKDFLKTIENVSKNVQIFYNTHLISLFDEKELDRVVLVKLDNKNRTIIEKPWTNKIEEVAAPVYHALGFDKLIFENVKKILFVEGISDKFIFEDLQRVDKNLKEWYIHPLSGGNKLEDSKLIKRIKLLACLSAHKEIKYRFVLDGDRRKVVDEKYPEIKDKVSFLGSESQEMEDLLNRDFYLNCVLECYQNIFIDNPDNLRKIEKIIEDIKKNEVKSKITKKIEEKFQKYGLRRFSKVDVAILIKRKLKRGECRKEDFSDLLKELKKLEKL